MLKIAVFLLSASAVLAQVPSLRLIRAVGQGSVTIVPDQVKINIGVITTASTAQDAAAQNASQSATMQAAVQKVLGNQGDIRTVSYSITTNYRYPPNEPAVLTGYTASNTVEVTINNVNLAGPIIDAANQAGANSIGSLRFGLKDDSIARAQALAAAARQARSHADAIASGLNARVGNVYTAQEGVSSPVPLAVTTSAPGATNTPTPIDTGTLTIQATVTVDFEIVL